MNRLKKLYNKKTEQEKRNNKGKHFLLKFFANGLRQNHEKMKKKKEIKYQNNYKNINIYKILF